MLWNEVNTLVKKSFLKNDIVRKLFSKRGIFFLSVIRYYFYKEDIMYYNLKIINIISLLSILKINITQ